MPERGRPEGSRNIQPHEIETMRRLFREGVPMADIQRLVGRGEAAVYRHTADLTRPKPPPRPSG